MRTHGEINWLRPKLWPPHHRSRIHLSSSVSGIGFVCGEGFYRAVALAGGGIRRPGGRDAVVVLLAAEAAGFPGNVIGSML